MITKRCIALYSGGLDSILAIKMIQEQDVDVVPLHFYSPFFGFDIIRDPQPYKEYHLTNYGINVHLVDYTEEIIQIVKNPKHGHGKHLNPCIDCKIGMLKKCKALMENLNASFVITGEVLGQRPMSQRRDPMRSIEKDSDLQGILLRPLCAKHMPETLPEHEGVVNRELLGDMMGRGRKAQLALARKYGIDQDNIPTPAGGCLLTDEQISSKIANTFKRFHPKLPAQADFMIDIVGRQFLLDESTVLVVSRNEDENRVLSSLKYPGNIFLKIADVPGPLCVLRGNSFRENLEKGAAICMRYGKARGLKGNKALYGTDPLNLENSIDTPVFSDDYCKSFQIDLHK
jgi:tRNA-specific 2-thiouridylase